MYNKNTVGDRLQRFKSYDFSFFIILQNLVEVCTLYSVHFIKDNFKYIMHVSSNTLLP